MFFEAKKRVKLSSGWFYRYSLVPPYMVSSGQTERKQVQYSTKFEQENIFSGKSFFGIVNKLFIVYAISLDLHFNLKP